MIFQNFFLLNFVFQSTLILTKTKNVKFVKS